MDVIVLSLYCCSRPLEMFSRITKISLFHYSTYSITRALHAVRNTQFCDILTSFIPIHRIPCHFSKSDIKLIMQSGVRKRIYVLLLNPFITIECIVLLLIYVLLLNLCITMFSMRQSLDADAAMLSRSHAELLETDLCTYLNKLDFRLKEASADPKYYSAVHLGASFRRKTEMYHQIGDRCAYDTLGFSLSRRPSTIGEAGTGVFVSNGGILQNHLVAVYPGRLIIEPFTILYWSNGRAYSGYMRI